MEQVQMSAEERKEYEAFKAEREKKRREEERKQQRQQYATLVDDEIAATIPKLREVSEMLKKAKDNIFGSFDTILKMKAEIIGASHDGQCSHTFTNSDSTLRIILGVNTIDGYRDTVEDGIAMVKGYIESLAKDDATKALVNAVLRLLSRDGQGNIKASPSPAAPKDGRGQRQRTIPRGRKNHRGSLSAHSQQEVHTSSIQR